MSGPSPERNAALSADEDAALLRRLYRQLLRHHVAILEGAEPGKVSAATLDAARKFLSDNGVDLRGLGHVPTFNVPLGDLAFPEDEITS